MLAGFSAVSVFGNTITVTNTSDSGPGSLRDAIANASPGDTINFAQITLPAIITLTSGELLINQDLIISGPGASTLVISGNNSSRVFEIAATVAISGLTIQNGLDYDGGAISNRGTLVLTNTTVSGNSAGDGGGGIFNSGTLTVTNSTLSSNSATGNFGGGIFNYFGTATVINSTLSGNSSIVGGGGIDNHGGTVTLTFTTLSGNSAPNGGGIFNYGGPTNGSTTVKNVIIANSPRGGNCYVPQGTITSQGYNLSDDSSCSSFFTQTDINNIPARLDPTGLQNEGGPTQTIALLATSPAVDAIPTGSCTDVNLNSVTIDQRGRQRPQGSACDIGALETRVWTVTSLADDGSDGTLRSVIQQAWGGDNVKFGVTGTITLSQNQLEVNKNLSISGPSAANLTISGNDSTTVIMVDAGSSVSLSGATIANGNSIANGNGGGGIWNKGSLSLRNSVISNSSTGCNCNSGGGIRNDGGLTVDSSTFSGNSGAYGGAIGNWGTLSVTNATFAHNGAAYGGGIYNGATGSVVNSTFFSNSAGLSGAATDGGDALMLKSSLFANNFLVDGVGNPYASGSCTGVLSRGYNLSDDNYCAAFLTQASDLNNTPPNVDPNGLANNGGPTPTVALFPGSPAVDAISVAACTSLTGEPISFDQRGITRPQDSACDIGAFEFTGVPPTFTSAGNTTFTVGLAASFTVMVAGVPAPTLSEAGTLPSGVTFNATTGVLSGTPATGTAGTYSIQFIASNGVGSNVIQDFSLKVIALQSVAVTPINPSLAKGLTLQFTATGTFTDASTRNITSSVTWTSSKPAVATITSAGLATAVSQGTDIIRAASGSISGSTTLTVATPALVSIGVRPANPTIPTGGTQQFVATGTYTDSSTKTITSSVTWSSSNTAVAAISSGGLATGVSPGISAIKATLGSISGTTALSVQPALVSISVAPLNPSIRVGATVQFTATGHYSDNSTQDVTGSVAWTSSKPTVATISATGLATAVAKGNTSIKAKLGAVTSTTTLTVTP